MEYTEAKRIGRKTLRDAMTKKEYPYVRALDELLENQETAGSSRVGVVEIPLSLVVGTRTRGRAESFARDFMPILSEQSEFAMKWEQLYNAQMEEGIRDPIKAFEYQGRFYVQEGNKRVSVLKYVGAQDILAEVTRLYPAFSDEEDARVYGEYVQFNSATHLFGLLFEKPGEYEKTAALFGENLEGEWPEEKRVLLRAAFRRFKHLYQKDKPDAEAEALSGAFLRYGQIFGVESLTAGSDGDIRENMEKAKAELELATRSHRVALIEQPRQMEMEPHRDRPSLFELLFSVLGQDKRLKIAFLNEKTPETSRWTYGHALGWRALSDKYGDEVEISVYNGCDTEELTQKALDQAIAEGAQIIFTTAGQMQPQVVKAALDYPKIKFLNCSVNAAFRSMRTYYARMYEAKFVLGTIAAAMSEEDTIGYVADYPVYGAVASINAFAIGAQMINPRARIRLKWSSLREDSWLSEFQQEGVRVISGPDMKVPAEEEGLFGLFRLPEGDGRAENLAMPLLDWGRYYELLVASVLEGSFNAKELTGSGQAVNYYFGMSAGVVDVICANRLPYATKKLAEVLRSEILYGDISPFYGEIHTKAGKLKEQDSRPLSYYDIVNMDWLNENIEGNIPDISEFKEDARRFIEALGVKEQEA